MSVAPLSIKQVKNQLATEVIGREVHYFASIGSTNEEAKRLAAAGAPEGTLVIADEQTAGKGRMGRHWIAPPNTCLLMSIIFRPALPPNQVPRLTMLCSLAAVEAIHVETGLDVSIKWPNDLVRPNVAGTYHKLAGVLTETSLTGDQLSYAIVGMGVNVNLDPAALGPVMTPATSLLAELGQPVDRVTLLVGILAQIEARYLLEDDTQRKRGRIEGGIHREWTRRLVTLGQQVTVTTAGEQLRGVAESVEGNGALLLRDRQGNLHRIVMGDVSLLPATGTKPF